jgi:pullulanase/glycogen debranching enzyme
MIEIRDAGSAPATEVGRNLLENAMKIEEGLPNLLGATWDGRGTNFALFSANATKVEVCIFDSFDGS